MDESSNRVPGPSWWNGPAFTSVFITREIIQNEQRQRRATRGRRLVDAADSAKCPIRGRLLLRERAGLPAFAEQKSGRGRLGKSRFDLRRLFLFCRAAGPLHGR